MNQSSSDSTRVSAAEVTEMLARVAAALDAVGDQLRRIEVRLALAPLPTVPRGAGPGEAP